MTDAKETRYSGVEDEFRVTVPGSDSLAINSLASDLNRFFFDESGHVPIFEPVHNPDDQHGRLWSWYGGVFSYDYDDRGTLVEAATPLTPLNHSIGALTKNVIAQRAQLFEITGDLGLLGNSTHVSLLLDSGFQDSDLCDFSARVPSNSFNYIEAQKLGADISLVLTNTISPVIAYLLFNPHPRKGAIYRPRKSRRLELCLPYQPDPERMQAGFLFWFAAVDTVTRLIKEDLNRHPGWSNKFLLKDYYRLILTQMPVRLSGVVYCRPSYYIGYQSGSGEEDNVMSNGSKAIVDIEDGKMDVRKLAYLYFDFFSEELEKLGNEREIESLRAFISGKVPVAVDNPGLEPASFRLDGTYIQKVSGKNASEYLDEHEPDSIAQIHAYFIKNPFCVIKPYSQSSPSRLIRNLGAEVGWETIELELVEETETEVRRYLVLVPLDNVPEYIKLEQSAANIPYFLEGARRWIKKSFELPNPRTIFAYGTLMNPETDRRYFDSIVESISPAHAYGEAFDFGEYPVLVETYGSGIVQGKILTFLNFEETANRFDLYEGCNHPNPIFFRALREVTLENGERKMTWIYIGNRNNQFVRDKIKESPRLTKLWEKGTVRSYQVPMKR